MLNVAATCLKCSALVQWKEHRSSAIVAPSGVDIMNVTGIKLLFRRGEHLTALATRLLKVPDLTHVLFCSFVLYSTASFTSPVLCRCTIFVDATTTHTRQTEAYLLITQN